MICNEVLEHVEELVPSLQGMAEVLTLGGYLIATVPFLYGQQEHLVKAIWRGDGEEPQVIGEPDYHGNPVKEEGSLVYRYPGWQLLGICARPASATRRCTPSAPRPMGCWARSCRWCSCWWRDADASGRPADRLGGLLPPKLMSCW